MKAATIGYKSSCCGVTLRRHSRRARVGGRDLAMNGDAMSLRINSLLGDALASTSLPAITEALRMRESFQNRLADLSMFAGIEKTLGMIHDASSIGRAADQFRLNASRLVQPYRLDFEALKYANVSEKIGLEQSKLLETLAQQVGVDRSHGLLQLPDYLESSRLSDITFAERLVEAHRQSWWDEAQIVALNAHTALSSFLDRTTAVDFGMRAAIDATLATPFPEFSSFRSAGQFLEISGLLRFPKLRQRSHGEKRGRVKEMLQDNKPPRQVRKAHSLFHTYERSMRIIIADAMEEEYGENWAAERLPVCGCKTLLGRTLQEGETVLDSADFYHYRLIMCFAEHYERVFTRGFDDVEELEGMLSRLGRLRGLSHHARTFQPEDLRESATLWRTMEIGLGNLLHDWVVDLD